MPNLKVKVTKHLIDTAIRSNAGKCMISNAIAAAYPGRFTRIWTDLGSIRMTDLAAGYRYTYFNCQKNQRALIKFDEGKRVPEFDFSLAGNAEGIAQPLPSRRHVKRRQRTKADVGVLLEARKTSWRDPRKRSGKNLPKGQRRPKKFTVHRKFGVCLL